MVSRLICLDGADTMSSPTWLLAPAAAPLARRGFRLSSKRGELAVGYRRIGARDFLAFAVFLARPFTAASWLGHRLAKAFIFRRLVARGRRQRRAHRGARLKPGVDLGLNPSTTRTRVIAELDGL